MYSILLFSVIGYHFGKIQFSVSYQLLILGKLELCKNTFSTILGNYAEYRVMITLIKVEVTADKSY